MTFRATENIVSPRTLFPFIAIALFVVLTSSQVAAQSTGFPAPRNLGDPDELGRGIQRTMTLLATSTPEKRNTVRILLYGQSITAGKWGVLLEEHLKQTYPHANLIYVRRPLSGFSTERLVKTSEADLYPFYADLVIFHDYGNNEDYESMIRRLRQQTTAEVVIQADHVRRSEQLVDESDPSQIESRRQRWAASRNYEFLPRIANQYGCAFDGRRDLWKDYLTDQQLDPSVLVKDDVHPNDHGTFLMTELIKAFLVPRSDASVDPMDCGYVTTFPVDKSALGDNQSLQFDFSGNRIDVVFEDVSDGSITVELDGKRPLDDATMFYHGRNRVKWRDTPIPPGPWPAVLKMSSEKPLVQESWTLQAKRDPADSEHYRFSVKGTVTGEDGTGRTDQRFVSDSGRVVIEPDDWDVRFAIVALRRLEELPDEFQLDWSVQTQAVNEAVPPKPENGIERVVTLAQRIADGEHRLKIDGDIRGIKALRVYSPSKFPCPANDIQR